MLFDLSYLDILIYLTLSYLDLSYLDHVILSLYSHFNAILASWIRETFLFERKELL